MASADVMRGRLRLDVSELDIVARVGTDDGQAGRMLGQALRPTGAMPDGRLAPWADQLLTVVARPAMRLVVELFAIERTESSIWATPALAVLGEPRPEGIIELSGVEPIMLPHLVAWLVGLRNRPRPTEPAAITTSITELAKLEQAARSGAAPDTALARLIAVRRFSWRITSVWVSPSGPHRGELHVVDGDTAGLWRIHVADRKAADPVLTFEPTSASAIWKAIVGLLPTSEVLQDAA